MATIVLLKQNGSNVYPLVHIDGVVDDNGNTASMLYAPRISYTDIIPLAGLLPNVDYDFGTTDIVNVVLDTTNIDNTMSNEWHFFFTALSTSCSVTLPNTVHLGNGYVWDIVAGRTFEVSIKHNIAYVGYCDS